MTDTTKAEPDYFITVRIPASLHSELRALAKSNERTLAAEVRLAVRARIDHHNAGSK